MPRCWPVPVEALDVGEHNQPFGLQADGERSGGGVGVDVVHHPVEVWGDAGHDRHAAGVDQPLDGLGPYRCHVTDQSEIDLLAVDKRLGG